jgi:hypothetical protein
VAHIPKDVVTVLGKRGDDILEKMVEKYYKTWGRPMDSSDAEVSSSSAAPRPDHGSTDDVQAPAPNPAPSTPFVWKKPLSPLTIPPMSGSVNDRFKAVWDIIYSGKSSDASEYSGDERATAHGPKVNPNPIPASPNEIGLAPEQQVEHVQQPNLGPSSSAPPGPDHESTSVVQSPAPNPDPSSSAAPMQGSWDHLNSQWDDLWWYKPGANSRPATPPSPGLGSPKEPENEVVPESPTTPESTDPSDPQSLSAGVRPEDLQDAIYAEKGKAKDSRSISDTARDVGNVAQKELQLAERSPCSGE